VQALNQYEGTVVLVSHDRHMLELTADRLVLVDNGTATEYEGTLDDYTDMILGKNQPKGDGGGKGNKKGDKKAAAAAREAAATLRKAISDAEADLAKLEVVKSAIDRAMFDPASADKDYAKLTMGELMQRRAKVGDAIAEAESRWVAASEAVDVAA
jgi:ATP-binding cassette, subfamily F, member 3